MRVPSRQSVPVTIATSKTVAAKKISLLLGLLVNYVI
jgi:hypothetical protein